uniref:MotA/TolQ/ExbB proton channel family protein n=1 Tax=Leptospirillum ferriphilum TaxID=178606 RepID=A0A7C3QTT0_9BACT
MSFLDYLMHGGPMMYVLLPLSVLSISVIIERYLYLRREKNAASGILEGLRVMAGRGETFSGVREWFFENGSSSRIMGRVGALFFRNNSRFSEDLENLVASEALFHEKEMKERMWILDTTITMAPLLGLLGTIMGIISSFHVMSVSGLGKPAQITGGVAEALISTATGLVVAIVALVFYNLLNAISREIRMTIESATRLLFHMKNAFFRDGQDDRIDEDVALGNFLSESSR